MTKIVFGLDALGFDGIEVNFRSVIELASIDAKAYGRVLKSLDRRLKKDGKDARLHGLKGKVLSNLGRYEEAEKALKTSLKLDGRQVIVD